MQKVTLQVGLKNILLLKKLEILFHVISDLNGEEIAGKFYKKELQKPNQTKFKVEKLVKRKGDKIYVKWKCYDNSFNIWIDQKDIK